MRLIIWPLAATDCETRKSPPVDIVFVSTSEGLASLTCWRKVGTRVVPQRGASSTGVGIAELKPRRPRRLRATVVVEANISKLVSSLGLSGRDIQERKWVDSRSRKSE